MKVYFVRHGETNWNKEKKIQGQVDIPLNDFGIHLAQKTKDGLKDVIFDCCFTSPLSRAYQTAQIILEGREVPIIKEECIEEMSFGEYEGKCILKKKGEIPDSFEDFFIAPGKYVPPKGGESIRHLVDRTEKFIERIKKDKELQDKTILVTTHGAALGAMLYSIKQESMEKFWGTGVHKNCAVTEVEFYGDRTNIVFENKVYYDDKIEPWER